MKTLIANGKAGNRVTTHFAAYEIVKEEEPVYQPSKNDLRMWLVMVFGAAGILWLALWKAWELACVVGHKLGELL